VAASSGQGFFGLQGNPDGTITPLDEPAVAAAKADHLAVKFGGLAQHPIAATYASGFAYAAPLYGHHLPLAAAVNPGFIAPYAGPLHFPTLVAHPNGAVVPADEPAVAAARAEHLSAHGAAYGGLYAAASPAVYASGYAAPSFYGLVAHPNGAVVPVDEPAVAAARAEHLSAHGAAYGGLYSAASPAVYASGYAAPSFYGLVAHPNGAVVPVDEPAVAAARAEHLSAHGAAYGGLYAAASPAGYASGYAAPSFYGLVAHPNGAVVPVDEPAVAAARAEHLAAFGK
jgi:hypothetical protein